MGPIFRQALFAGTIAMCALCGCSEPSKFEFDGFDLAPHEELSEIQLGKYSIPIPVAEERGGRLAHRNRFQLDFELYALVPPGKESSIADDLDRHEGKIRDRVIRVCRNASIEDLMEPELSTLKARLMDALAGQVGEQAMRQLLITEIVSQRL